MYQVHTLTTVRIIFYPTKSNEDINSVWGEPNGM